jgi:hypothetical protein
MKHWILFATLALGAGTMAAETLLPLEPGNTWTYRDKSTGSTFTVRVGVPVAMQSGAVYYMLNGYAETRLLVRMNEEGNLAYYDEELERERVLTPMAGTLDMWWDVPQRPCENQARMLSKRSVYEGPAGRWSDVAAVEYRTFACADAGVQREEFAANLGMLRRVVTTLRGPVTYDLVYARLGRQEIVADDAGTFRVSAVPAPGGQSWKVTLRLALTASNPLLLRFASSQEYDIVVRDAEGKPVWTWSDGQAFLTVMHDREVSSGWSADVDVPWPAVAGDYTVEGWLTTAAGAPKFAATAATLAAN